MDNGRYPNTQQGLDALIVMPALGPRPRQWKKYLQDLFTVPKDPWGNDYIYQCPGPRGEPYLIVSYGADGRPDGIGDDVDVTSVEGGVERESP